jgi:PHD/YefM family antitoxin component YafN of YafNO toxin-antitoxin module
MTVKGCTMRTESISVTEFKRNADAWVDWLQDQEALVLTLRGQGRLVLMSLDRYRQTQAEFARMLQGIGAKPARKSPVRRKSKGA